MLRGVEYSITVKVQRKVTEGDPQRMFAGLYARATAIAVARCHEFARDEDVRQHRSPQRATEVFVEFDHRHRAAGAAPLFVYSYGERAAVDTVDSFEPFVELAKNNARTHQARFNWPTASS